MSAPIVSAQGPRPRGPLTGSDVVGRHLNFNVDKTKEKRKKKEVFFFYLQGFGAFSQQFLDVPGRRRHQLLRVVGLHGEVRTVFLIHLRQRGVKGERGASEGTTRSRLPGLHLLPLPPSPKQTHYYFQGLTCVGVTQQDRCCRGYGPLNEIINSNAN